MKKTSIDQQPSKLPPPQVPSAPPTSEAFIDIKEVADRLKMTVRTIYTYKRRDYIPYYKIGRHLRFKWSEVEAAFANNPSFHKKAA